MAFGLLKLGLRGQTAAQAGAASAAPAQAALRRGDHRRRRTRAGDRLLPRPRSRHRRRRGAGEGLSGRRQYRAQHRHRPLELPDPGGRGVLRRIDRALPRPVGRARLQHHVYRARPPDARAHRRRAQDDALAGGGEQASGGGLRGGRARRAARDRSAAQSRRRRALSRPRRALPQAGAIARHDAVAWGYAIGAARRGVEIHQKTRGDRDRPGVGPRRRGRDRRRAHRLRSGAQAVAGSSTLLADMAGFALPIHTVPLAGLA